MTLRNPRRFSVAHAIAIGVGVALEAFISICFEFGNGSLIAGLPSAAGYFVIYSMGIMILVAFAMGVASVAGRIIGTTIATALAFCLLSASVITSYVGSKPISRFRRLIWE